MVKLKIGLYKHKETGQFDVMINQIDNTFKVHNGEFKKVKEFEYYEETKRFIVTEDTIEDTQTGLIWERDMSKRGEMTLDEAMKINEEGFKLPSGEDFKTLAKSKEYPTIEELEKIGFQNVRGWYWTLNKYINTYAHVVSFYYGSSGGNYVTNSHYVLCVKK